MPSRPQRRAPRGTTLLPHRHDEKTKGSTDTSPSHTQQHWREGGISDWKLRHTEIESLVGVTHTQTVPKLRLTVGPCAPSGTVLLFPDESNSSLPRCGPGAEAGPSRRKARGEGTRAVEPGHGAGRKATRWEFWPRPPFREDLPHQRARGTPPACRARYGQKLRGCSTCLSLAVCPQPSQAGTATQLALQTRRQGPRDASRRTRQSQPSRAAGPKPTSPRRTQSTFPIDGVLPRTISSLLWALEPPEAHWKEPRSPRQH